MIDFVETDITEDEYYFVLFAASQGSEEAANEVLKGTRFSLKDNVIYENGQPIGTIEIEYHTSDMNEFLESNEPYKVPLDS